jgi:chromosome segregation ATPase
MENSYELLITDQFKLEKQTTPLNKVDELTKSEKPISIDLPNYYLSKNADPYKNLEPKQMMEKQRIRQFISSRTEIQYQIEGKSPVIKKNYESIQPCNSKVPFLPLLSIRTNALEEVYKEIKELKAFITEIEEKNKVNMQCIDINKVRINDMEERYLKLKQKAGIGCSHEERKEELVNKLKNLQNNWKKSTNKLKQTVQDLEEEVKNLSIRSDNIRTQLFKKGQEQRVLKRNLNESSSNSENGYHSCDLLNSSSQLKTLMHTPSWNTLYHVNS